MGRFLARTLRLAFRWCEYNLMHLFPRDPGLRYSVASAYQLRPMNSRRMQRLRAAWFALGIAVGVSAGVGLAKWLEHRPLIEIALDAPIATSPVTPPVTPSETPQEVATPAQQAEEKPAPQQAMALASEPFGPPAPPVVAAKPALTLPATLTYTLRKRETLQAYLREKGLTEAEIAHMQEAMKPFVNVKRMGAGQAFTAKLVAHPQEKDAAALQSLTLDVTPLKTLTLTRNDKGGFNTKEIKNPVYKGMAHAGGVIRSSLYQTAIDSGIPVKMVGEIIQAFSYDIDFQRDIHRGDRIDVVFENTHTEKNVTTSIGKMMYASLTLDGESYTIYRHVAADGFSGFYNAKGESVKKALLRTPINGAHVTSGFGMRMHPLLGYSKMHKGVDFGAPTGTPIYAAGDGVVEEAGRKGGYGNFVKLRHNKSYATAYGHASRLAKGIHKGTHVRQGQVIAYVGSTGQSTGPHLHYEVIMGSAPVNPAGVKFRTGQTLAGREFAAFKKEKKQIETTLANRSKKIQVAALP